VPRIRSLAPRLAQHRAWLPWLVVVSLLALFHGGPLVEHVRTSLDPFCFADDVRVLIHPLYRVEDGSLFPRDPMADYYLASLPDGYHLFYRLFGPLIGVAALSKALPYALFVTTLVLLAVAAHRFGGIAAAFGTLSLALGSAFVLGRAVGGLPRGFAMPLVAGGAACLVFGRARALAALTVVAAGFYPVVALLLGTSLSGLLLLPPSRRGCTAAWSVRRRLLLLAGTAVLAVAFVVPSARRLSGYGPPVTPAAWHRYPEAGPGGRFQDVDRPPFMALPKAALPPLESALVGAEVPLLRLTDARRSAAWLCPLLAVLAAVGWIVQARRRPEALRLSLLAASAVLCHTASLVLEPRLFLPERHLAYAVPVMALLAVPATLGALVTAERRSLRALPFVFVALVLALLGAHGSGWTGISVRVPPADRPLYAAVARLPPGAVIAGFPDETTDSIPYLSRRTAFVTRETHMPFHEGFAAMMGARMRALTSAYFSTSADPVRELRDRHGVTHVLVDRRHFDAPPPYFVPFAAEIARAFERGRSSGFFFASVPPSAVVVSLGDYRLIDLSKL